MEYGPAIDMWSAGCMLYELRTGKPLFTGWSEHDQLCRIEASLGVIPQSMHANVPVVYKTRYFERGTRRMIPSQEIVRLERKNGTPAPNGIASSREHPSRRARETGIDARIQ